MNSREKGKRGERQWRDELRAHGYDAWRGQQFAGSPDSPDVVCPDLAGIHFEVKAVERLNIYDAMEQARRDCRTQNAEGGMQKVPVVAHRRRFWGWLVTMEAEAWFTLVSMCQELLNAEARRRGGMEAKGDHEILEIPEKGGGDFEI